MTQPSKRLVLLESAPGTAAIVRSRSSDEGCTTTRAVVIPIPRRCPTKAESEEVERTRKQEEVEEASERQPRAVESDSA